MRWACEVLNMAWNFEERSWMGVEVLIFVSASCWGVCLRFWDIASR